MTAEKKRRPHDVDAWRQLALVRIALKNKATSKADIAVLTEIIQRYHGQYGNGWASLDMLMSETGLHKTSVQRSVRRLVDLTFVDIVAQGRRGRATVYVPNFALVPEKGSVGATLTTLHTALHTAAHGENEPSFGSAGATLSPEYGSAGATETGTLGSAAATPSSLPVPAYKAEVRDREGHDLCGATPPPAPLAVGQAAAVPHKEETKEERFDVLFDVYGWRQKRAEAWDAFNALPDGVDHDAILVSAGEWRKAWVEDGDAKTGRRSLGQWLKRKDYTCEPSRRRPEKGAGTRSSARASIPAANDNRRSGRPCVAVPAKVLKASVESEFNSTIVYVSFETESHGTHDACFTLESLDENVMAHGGAQMTKLLRAVGLRELNDTDDLHGLELLLTTSKGGGMVFEQKRAAA